MVLRRRTRNGNASIIGAFGFVVLSGFSALVIDIGYMRVVEAQLQVTADASAHAAIAWLDGTPEGMDDALIAAQELAEMNPANGRIIDMESALTFGFWLDDEFIATNEPTLVDSVQVVARDEGVSATMGRLIFDVDYMTVEGEAIAAAGPYGPAGAVSCYLPLAVPECLFDSYSVEELHDMDFRFGSDGVDNIAWAVVEDNVNSSTLRELLEDCQSTGGAAVGDSVYLDNGVISSALTTLGEQVVGSDTSWDEDTWGAIGSPLSESMVDTAGAYGNTVDGVIIVFEEDDCTDVKFNQTKPLVGFVKVSVYDVRTDGGSSEKNIRAKLDLREQTTEGTEGGGLVNGMVAYQKPGGFKH